MVIIIKPRIIYLIFCLVSMLMLTGCPGIGDRVLPREEAKVSMQGDNVCFWIPGVSGLEPVHIAINPWGTPFRQQKVIFNPDIKIMKGKLCIPPSFFQFPKNGRFTIEYVLDSKKTHAPRIVEMEIVMSEGRAYAGSFSGD